MNYVKQAMLFVAGLACGFVILQVDKVLGLTLPDTPFVPPPPAKKQDNYSGSNEDWMYKMNLGD